jgi:hypothetical protein
MRTIWKYEIPKHDFCVEIPIGAKFLHLATEPQRAMWWEIPATEAPKTNRYFRVFITGEEIPQEDGMTYLGTMLIGSFVFHVYDTT